MNKKLSNLLIYFSITIVIIFAGEMIARKFEKNPFYKIQSIAYTNLKKDFKSNEWKLKNIKSCSFELFETFNDYRRPLVPLEHLIEKQNKSLASFTDELGLTLKGRGPRKNSDKNILVIGGSTIHGDGLECDEYTLPSNLNYSFKYKISFHNHGTSAYSSKESSDYFLKLIKHYKKPEEVWFIEGINDVMRKVVRGVPSYTYSFSAIGMSSQLSLRYFIIESLASRSALFRIIFKINPRVNGNIVESDKLYPKSIKNFRQITKKEFIGYRAKLAAEMTINNYLFVKDIANLKGINLKIFSQPNLFDKNNLSNVEKNILDEINEYYPIDLLEFAFKKYYENLNIISKKKKIEIIELRDCLKNQEKSLFFDLNHLAPEGNRLLAECITKKITN